MSGSHVIGFVNSINRAVLSALTASDTLILVNCKVKKTLTYAGRALLINNVSDIFVTEEIKGSKNGVGSSLTETAEGVLLNVVTKLFELVYILESAVALSNLVEHFKKSSGTDTAGSTLTA